MHDEQDPEPVLPPGLDVLWGQRPKGRHGPKPGLSIDAIVATAIALADADGLDALSMARLAKELGFTTMSLYRYVNSKDELLQLMWNASAQGAERLVLEGEGWRPRLRMWATVQRDVIDLHPWITEMPMAAPPLAPNSLTFVERGLETMEGTGLTDGEKLRIIALLSSYTLSEARMAHDAARAARQAAAAGLPAPPISYEALLRQLIDEEHYPVLYRIAWAQPDGAAGPDEHEEYLFGVERILDSVQALIEHRTPAG